MKSSLIRSVKSPILAHQAQGSSLIHPLLNHSNPAHRSIKFISSSSSEHVRATSTLPASSSLSSLNLKNRRFIRQEHKLSSLSSLHQDRLQKVLLVKKPYDDRARLALDSLISYLNRHQSQIQTIVEQDLVNQQGLGDQIDLVIALGGDGTVLHISHLFKNTACPPILGFNLGTIGFLLPFPPEERFDVIQQVLNGQIRIEERMRLNCFIGKGTLGNHDRHQDDRSKAQDPTTGHRSACSLVDISAMNEVSLHRNECPHMVAINISIEDKFLTKSVSDGLIIATPTGSTAYSCSAGGSIVHPSMEAMLLTPICPRSLSFRPLVLPSNLHVRLTVDPRSRSTAELRVDGIGIKPIQPGESIEIRRSDHPIQLVYPPDSNSNSVTHDSWISDLNLMLNFNRSYQPKDHF